MANRTKTKRNAHIVHLHEQGWRDQSIANMLHMTRDAVKQVLHRHRVRVAQPALQSQTEGMKGETNGKGQAGD